MTKNPKEPIVKRAQFLPAINDVCGEIKVFLGKEDSVPAGFAVAEMRGPTIPHVHKVTTEYYFVLSGRGVVIVAGQRIDVDRNTLVVIKPMTSHYTIPDRIMSVLAITILPWTPEDQIVLTEDDWSVGYSAKEEKRELVEQIFLRDTLCLGPNVKDLEKLTIPELRKRLEVVNFTS